MLWRLFFALSFELQILPLWICTHSSQAKCSTQSLPTPQSIFRCLCCFVRSDHVGSYVLPVSSVRPILCPTTNSKLSILPPLPCMWKKQWFMVSSHLLQKTHLQSSSSTMTFLARRLSLVGNLLSSNLYTQRLAFGCTFKFHNFSINGIFWEPTIFIWRAI